MKLNLTFLFIITFSLFSVGQVNLNQTFKIPSELPESSGITSVNDDFWLINDSGNDPIIYKLNSVGTIIHSIYVKGKNIDYQIRN